MRCPHCVEAGDKSTVTQTITAQNLDFEAKPFWDEDDKFHIHDKTTTTTHYRCDHDPVHVLNVTSELQPCPQGDYP